jgi:Transposase, Mutator family
MRRAAAYRTEGWRCRGRAIAGQTNGSETLKRNASIAFGSCTGCAPPWPTCPRGSRRWSPPPCAKPAFLQPDQASARRVWRQVADQLRPRWPKLAALMDESEPDVLAYMGFPAQHRAKLHSTNPLERLNKEVKRRADVVGIFPSEPSIVRLIGAVLLEQNDEWQLRHRYMQVEAMAELASPAAETEPALIPPKAA